MNEPMPKSHASYIVAQHVTSIARKSGREVTRELCEEVLTMMQASGANTNEQPDEWLRDRIAPCADVDTVYQKALDWLAGE